MADSVKFNVFTSLIIDQKSSRHNCCGRAVLQARLAGAALVHLADLLPGVIWAVYIGEEGAEVEKTAHSVHKADVVSPV